MTTTFRRATTADIPTLLGLMRDYYAFDGHRFDPLAASRVLGELIGDERNGMAWLIQCDGVTAGYMALCLGFSLEFGGRDAFLDEIYLDVPYRGQGVGRAAIDLLIAEARQLGVRALHLEVDRDNARAERTYRALGFQPRDRFRLMSLVLAD
jgi:ribosomal protein S18 acetylase RimI-like enzyme